ncbi:MAG TPA: hypothetical protein V6C96_01790 [Vampirovibrionales bacterium]
MMETLYSSASILETLGCSLFISLVLTAFTLIIVFRKFSSLNKHSFQSNKMELEILNKKVDQLESRFEKLIQNIQQQKKSQAKNINVSQKFLSDAQSMNPPIMGGFNK